MTNNGFTPVHILGISGSLRRASFNTALLHTASEHLPPGATLEMFDLAALPLFNQDQDTAGAPPSVQALRARIAAADAVLIATPEYNYSVPGVLKNALDWASRPARKHVLNGKPGAIMGAGGMFGTVRAQMHLRQIAVELNMLLLNKPEVMVQRPWEKFDAEGRLLDERTHEQLQELMAALTSWTRRLRGEAMATVAAGHAQLAAA